MYRLNRALAPELAVGIVSYNESMVHGANMGRRAEEHSHDESLIKK